MKKTKAQTLYHYTDCGLDYIYLLNGYEMIEDAEFGKAVSIHHLDELNAAIAHQVVAEVPSLHGQELRFLRSMLKLNQTQMGRLLGRDLRTIQRWEEARDTAIDGAADRFLRLFYTAYRAENEVEQRVSHLLREAQAASSATPRKHSARMRRLELTDTIHGWKTAA